MKKSYVYAHVVGLEETNLVGNVYFTNHLKWQGICREMFIRDHCPGLLDQLRSGLALETVHCACEYFAEAHAFDRLEIHMTLAGLQHNRIKMAFRVQRVEPDVMLIARGEQTIACMHRGEQGTVPIAVPASLRTALEPYV